MIVRDLITNRVGRVTREHGGTIHCDHVGWWERERDGSPGIARVQWDKQFTLPAAESAPVAIEEFLTLANHHDEMFRAWMESVFGPVGGAPEDAA